jgi:phosphatidylserine/phosphatidylglycerophosphate/cardiolipin synthase-like enzyme
MNFTTKMLLISAIVVLCICLTAGAVFWFVLQPSLSQVVPVPQSPTSTYQLDSVPVPASWYQVYFTTPQYPDKPENRRGGLDEKLTAFINTAKTSVDMAIYQLDLPNVTQAMIDAKRRGVTVRVVTDSDILADPKENPSFKQLEQVGIPIVGGNANAIMHNKFVVVDKQAVWTGSWNFTTNDTYRYNNNAILIQSPELARNYTATFEKMFIERKFGGPRKAGGTTPKLTIAGVSVENYFAPEDKVADKIVARLKAATKTIDFMAFSFTDDNMGDAILARAQAGVKVRGVFENTGSETRFSEYGKFKDAKLDVWQDGNPYLMHHKVFILDNQTVIFGSFNFSANANEDNDENLLIIDDPALAAQFTAEFLRVYTQAKNPPKK